MIESLMARHPAVEAFTAVEHQFGALPLLDAFLAAVDKSAPTSLGLFTPAPDLGWSAAAIDGEKTKESDGDGLRLRGEIRLPAGTTGSSLVLARLAGPEGNPDHRLAWLDHAARGVRRSGTWLHLEDVAVGPDHVSRSLGPAPFAPGAPLFRHLEAYAGAWALAAALCAREGVRVLRRAARTTARRGIAFNTAQRVALGITEVEIETDLTAAAARHHARLAADDPARASGLALATAAARTLAALVLKTAELRDREGLAVDGPFACDATAASLTTFLGGAAMLESELGRALEASV